MPGELRVDAPADGVVRLTIANPARTWACNDCCGAIGEPRTRELFLLGQDVSSQTALGMVNRVVAGTDLEHAGLGVAGELAANVRALIDAGAPLDRDLEHELIALREACFHSEDLREGVRAFTEKRRPRWRGM